MKTKLNQLRTMLSGLAPEGICAAFSGGTDSSLLLTVLSELQAQTPYPLLAVIFTTTFQTAEETVSAQSLAEELAVPVETVPYDVLADPVLRRNPKDRCYQCKRRLFAEMKRIAEARGLKHLMDGTNADDTKVYRPGRKALEELGVLSPLAICGFTKDEVRSAARELLVPTAEKPSSPCLATRFPYGTELTDDALRRVERGETYLRNLGLGTVRLRVHGPCARLETDAEGFRTVAEHRTKIASELRRIGFGYAALDLEGFRSGSMDEPQPADGKEKPAGA
ncbi:MAG: ATP-dependent sacrificial sulfur transferase LarE [Lentisphaeria bacterium]|nr:ATP-dependent sacrificial sulfur transferase LarE [Lentisphaeria bacterium]